jgi:hypothetical protein
MDEESKSPENKSSSKQKSKSKMKSVQSDEADLQSPSSSSTAPPTGLNEATASLTMHHFLSGQFRHAGFDGAQASALREMERLTLSCALYALLWLYYCADIALNSSLSNSAKSRDSNI